MAWYEGVEETRVLIAPVAGPVAKENGAGNFLSLRHPKSGNKTCYLFINGMLQELHWSKQAYGSWFLGDYVNEDGSLYIATPIDPVFILLPIFDEARMKKGDDLGKFRQVDEMIFINGYPGYQHLLSIADNSMQLVCEVKEIGSSKFFRLDDSKVLSWLYYKVNQLKQTLLTMDKNYAAREEKETLADAVSILGEYLKDEPWLKLLCNHLKLDFEVVTLKRPSSDNLLKFSEIHGEDSSGISKDKSKGDKKKSSSRTEKMAKKSKVEAAESNHNIRAMFTRASARKK